MKKTGTTKNDFEMIEINEAFSVVVLANIKVMYDYSNLYAEYSLLIN